MNTMIAVGAVNALVFALIFRKKTDRTLPDRILFLFFLLSSAAQGAVFFALQRGWDLLLLPLQYANLLWAPGFFIYVHAMVDPRHRPPVRWPLHFVLLACAGLYQGYTFLTYSELEFTLVHTVRAFGDRPVLFNLFYVIDLLVPPTYLAWSLVRLREHRRRIGDYFSYRQSVDYRWLLRFILVSVATWLAIDLPYLGTLLIGGLKPDQILAVGFALNTVAILYLGFFALRQTSPYGEMPTEAPTEPAAPSTEPGSAPRYRKSGLPPDELRDALDRLVRHMERERPYLDPGLTVGDLAGRVGLTVHNLSEVMNVGLGRRFYDVVNGYRVGEFKRRAIDPANAHLTMLAIALQCGFNSKSSFNRIFKQHEGSTPSAYLKARASSSDASEPGDRA